MERGMIHLYHGDGKGKTTAAMGLALRAAGSGKRVVIVQFLKDGTSHEVRMLSKLPGVTVLAGKACSVFTWDMTEEQKKATRELHDKNLKKALAASCDLLVLDEVCGACTQGLVTQEPLQQLTEHKPEGLELVLTGRNPQPFMLEHADYITEMVKRRHPFDRGIAAREGIEF